MKIKNIIKDKSIKSINDNEKEKLKKLKDLIIG